jgi:hypothetical protein
LLRRRHLVLVALAAVSLCACADSPPPIGRGLPAAFADARTVFDRRVKERFPVGFDAERLVTELHREAFIIRELNTPPNRYRFSATYEAHQLVCNLSWTISWNAENSRITEIAGDYGSVCL